MSQLDEGKKSLEQGEQKRLPPPAQKRAQDTPRLPILAESDRKLRSTHSRNGGSRRAWQWQLKDGESLNPRRSGAGVERGGPGGEHGSVLHSPSEVIFLQGESYTCLCVASISCLDQLLPLPSPWPSSPSPRSTLHPVDTGQMEALPCTKAPDGSPSHSE